MEGSGLFSLIVSLPSLFSKLILSKSLYKFFIIWLKFFITICLLRPLLFPANKLVKFTIFFFILWNLFFISSISTKNSSFIISFFSIIFFLLSNINFLIFSISLFLSIASTFTCIVKLFIFSFKASYNPSNLSFNSLNLVFNKFEYLYSCDFTFSFIWFKVISVFFLKDLNSIDICLFAIIAFVISSLLDNIYSFKFGNLQEFPTKPGICKLSIIVLSYL